MHKGKLIGTRVLRWVRRILGWVSVAEAVVGGAALLMMFVLILVQVAQRYLPGGWAWTTELATYCLVWLTFGMLGHLMGRDGHITLQVLDNIKSRAFQRGLRIFANLVVLAVAIGLAIGGAHLLSAESDQVSPAMRMPLFILYVVPFVGFMLTALRAAVGLLLPAGEHPDDVPAPADSANQGVV